MRTWIKRKGLRARVWHVLTGSNPFCIEYRNGSVFEGVDLLTPCYVNGLMLERDAEQVESDEPPGPVCKACQRAIEREEATT